MLLNKRNSSSCHLISISQCLCKQKLCSYFTERLHNINFGTDEKAIQCSQQFECQTSLIFDIREVFSVLANQQLNIRNVLIESERSLIRDTLSLVLLSLIIAVIFNLGNQL